MFLLRYKIFLIQFALSISFLKEVSANKIKSILDEPKCGDVRLFCNNLSENEDILIIECLQSLNPKRLAMLNEDCQHAVWNHTRALIRNEQVRDFLLEVCKDDLGKLNCQMDGKDGTYLKCIVNNKDEIQNIDCTNMILRLENTAFQDYRWISNFLEHCTSDIESLKCGRVDARSLTQMQTISCLQNNILNIKDDCKKEVFKLSELQSDSIKLDSQLYLECAEDHLRYCPQFYAGSGRVFSCLMQQDQHLLAPTCRQHLLRRQKLIAQDYKVSKGLMKACKDDIKKTHCRRQTSSDKTIRLAQILLCLENIARNGTKLESECAAEMVQHRKMLMEDYRLSPEIVDNCKFEINSFCKGFEVGGKTIHCLMNHALSKGDKNRSELKDQCRRALESLVKQADAGEDWRVDPILHEACYPVVKTVCNDIQGGNARVLSCLMDNIGSDHMTDECEDALIQIQYFVARDFKLDPQLYNACKEDAAKYCHVPKNWEPSDNYVPDYGREVLPCLYRYAFHLKDNSHLNKSCLQQIRRVMRQRAISVDLQPEIEEVCLDDLAYFCHDKVKKGEEMMCLQKNFEELHDKCHDVITTYTEIQAERVELNPYIIKYCRSIIDMFCGSIKKHDEGDVMECLISYKNDPIVKSNQACRASIEHFQIISIKDYKFTYKFKIACKSYAMHYCGQAKTKNEVVSCLSEQIVNATVHSVKSDISKECRQQLKAQIFQQRENIDYDPKLKEVCLDDIKKFCKDIQPGNAQVLECLQSQHKQLTDKCEKEIFKVKKQEIFDNSVDYALITMCADAIEQFCPHHDKSTVLECLKMNKDKFGFNKKCRIIVSHRIVEQDSNYQLNPSLQENCKLDITKFCKNILKNNAGKDMNGPVITCLKESFKLSRLSNRCEKEMAEILRAQAMDINLNPLIKAVCKNELATICKNNEEEYSGATEECLKDALIKKLIVTPECRVEIANMIEESQADIQVDPLLQQACALDLLNYCPNIPQGNGRQIKCLTILMDNNSKQLSINCRNMLSKRLEMYRNAAQFNPPEDFNQLYRQVVTSPSKHYFFIMILAIFTIFFVIGVFCGRVSKKHQLLKNK